MPRQRDVKKAQELYLATQNAVMLAANHWMEHPEIWETYCPKSILRIKAWYAAAPRAKNSGGCHG